MPCMLFSLLLSANAMQGEKNPFLQFAGKPYGSYHYALRDTLRERFDHDNAARIPLAVKQMREVPDVFHDHQWEIQADFIEICFLHDYRKGSDESYVKELKRLLEESRKYHNKVFEFRIIRQLFDYSVAKDIPDKMDYTWQLEQMLKKVSPKEFPDVVDCQFRLGDMYMNFKNFKRAEDYFKMVVVSPFIKDIQFIFILARNNLGLINRNYYNDYDESDKWFRSILDFNKKHGMQESAYLWEAIVKGNIGKNYYYRKNYVRANHLMEESFKVMYGAKDYSFSYTLATALSQSYSALGKYDKALEFIHLAEKCATAIPSLSAGHEDLYLAKSKYYCGIGKKSLSLLYEDSASLLNRWIDNRYNMNNFLLIEKKNHQIELQKETDAKQAYKNRFYSILFVSIFIAISLAVYIRLYIQKKKAYRQLVLKNQQWANNLTDENPQISEAVTTTDEDDGFWIVLKDYVEKDMRFCDSGISLDTLAKELGRNRAYISNVVNKHGENFSIFINRYRIKQAIRLISKNRNESFESIAFMVGFNNRQSFYNAFKNLTGLSPSQFKNNLTSDV